MFVLTRITGAIQQIMYGPISLALLFLPLSVAPSSPDHRLARVFSALSPLNKSPSPFTRGSLGSLSTLGQSLEGCMGQERARNRNRERERGKERALL